MFMDELDAAEQRINGFDKSESRKRSRYNENRLIDDDLPVTIARRMATELSLETLPAKKLKTHFRERV